MKSGDTLSWKRTFTEDDIRLFAGLSGDDGEHHHVPNQQGRLMAHGLLTATLPTKIGGDMNLIARELSFQFHRPVFAGDTIECVVTLIEATPVIGQALTDSPAGLAAFMYDYNDGEPERLLAKDDFLDNVTLYWLTNSAPSSARLYWETSGQSIILAAAQKTSEISLPVAITVFPEEVYRAPETWARRAYSNLIYFKEVDKGGHFAAWEEPQLFSEEIRAAFRSLR